MQPGGRAGLGLRAGLGAPGLLGIEEEVPPTGDLESFKKQSFVLKEGVEYRIKISFRVSYRLLWPGNGGGARAGVPGRPSLIFASGPAG